MTVESPARPRQIVTEGDPESTYVVPTVRGDFQLAPDIERIAQLLIEHKFPDFPPCEIRYLWKRKGGASKGKAIYGKTQKAGGLLGFFSQVDYVVWLAADCVAAMDFTRYQVEAVVYHELLHFGQEVDEDTGEVSATLVGHDFEGFRKEVEEYGLWAPEVRSMAKAFQPHLI